MRLGLRFTLWHLNPLPLHRFLFRVAADIPLQCGGTTLSVSNVERQASGMCVRGPSALHLTLLAGIGGAAFGVRVRVRVC